MTKKEQKRELTREERRELREYQALIADYEDWEERHHGDYQGDYWE